MDLKESPLAEMPIRCIPATRIGSHPGAPMPVVSFPEACQGDAPTGR